MFFLGLFSFFQSSKLGCACGEGKCNPLFCDHVSMFDNDNMEARDKSGVPMKGRFPYDDQGRIILEVCTNVKFSFGQQFQHRVTSVATLVPSMHPF